MENKVSVRLKKIQDYISERGYVSVKQICKHFGISKSTISRDLATLSKEGLINRFHGGVIIAGTSVAAPFKLRSEINKEKKLRIARCAASLVEPGDVIYVGSGSTCLEFFSSIKVPNVTVFTNNISCLSNYNENIAHVYALGGEVFPHSETIFGVQLMNSISRIMPDKIFFSAPAISDLNIQCANFDEMFFLQALIQRNAKKFFLCDSSKLSEQRSFIAANIGDVDVFITDDSISPEYVERIKGMDVEFHAV